MADTTNKPNRKKHPDAWTVREHGPLERLAENLWWVSGALPGMSLRRMMVVAKLKDGRLVIHNGIAMNEAQQKELEALGEPAYLVVPNRGHRLDAPAYKKRYPNLKVLAPRGGKKGIEEAVPVDLTYDQLASEWKDPSIRFETLQGVNEEEGAMIVSSEDGATLVLNDTVFNMDRKKDVLGFLFTTLLGSAPGPRMSRLVKLLFVKDKKALKADLERLAELPELVRLAVAHEKIAHGPDAPAALRQAATYL